MTSASSILKKAFSYRAVRFPLYFGIGLAVARLPVYLSPERPLTPGEKTELKAVFGQSVDVNRIRISRSAAGDFLLMVHRAEMETVNSRILVKRSNYSSDYSKERSFVGIRTIFDHEAGHVWQNQNCPTAYLSSVANLPYRLINQHALYDVGGVKKDGKDLLAYGVEQQAEILSLHAMGLNISRALGKENDAGKTAAVRHMMVGGALDQFVENPAYLRAKCRFYGLPHPFKG